MRPQLPKQLKTRPFTYREASSSGLTQYEIRLLLAEGTLERTEYGVYRTAGIDLSESELFRRAVKKIGEPVAVCLLSALSYYELTDTIPNQVWLMVPSEKRTTSPNIKLYRARNPRWEIGVVAEVGYRITSLERTIVDSLTHKTLLPPRIGLEALKAAIRQGVTTASAIIEVSNALGVTRRILPYVEAMS